MKDCGPFPFRTDDLSLVKGADRGWTWKAVDANSQPLDITGWTAVMQARQTAESSTTRGEWTTGLGGGITISGQELTLRIDGDESSLWTWDRAVYEIQVSSPTDGPYYFTGGTLVAYDSVIHP